MRPKHKSVDIVVLDLGTSHKVFVLEDTLLTSEFCTMANKKNNRLLYYLINEIESHYPLHDKRI
jgi:hypothetical protein